MSDNPHQAEIESAFHAAVIRGDTKAIMLAVGQGCNVNCSDGSGWTGLMVAAFFGNMQAAAVLLACGADEKIVNEMGCNAYDYAVDSRNYDGFVSLLEKKSALRAEYRKTHVVRNVVKGLSGDAGKSREKSKFKQRRHRP